ncbi:hypothetical protein Barb7_02073 [Bacteroidales bacterium Barb7]|nr:hypothetical protein Barb7_02073 [Bacteroidales bacterium Barb7]
MPSYLILMATYFILTAGLRKGRHGGALKEQEILAPHGVQRNVGLCGMIPARQSCKDDINCK